MKNNDRKLKIASLSLSIGLYIISLTQIGYIDSPGNDGGDNVGVYLVIFGTTGFLAGGAALSWLANPILWVSWMTINKPKRCFWLSLISTFFSFSFLLFNKVYVGDCGGNDGYGTYTCYREIISRELGYYLWLTSCAILLGANFIRSNIYNLLKHRSELFITRNFSWASEDEN